MNKIRKDRTKRIGSEALEQTVKLEGDDSQYRKQCATRQWWQTATQGAISKTVPEFALPPFIVVPKRRPAASTITPAYGEAPSWSLVKL